MPDVQALSTYDLPYSYEDNRVVLMARDPHLLYAYWEISPHRKNNFIKEFGNEMWNKSVPVLKIYNVSKNTSFYVNISDSANNWYINVPDASSLYSAELGRRISEDFFINLAYSNYINTPGDAVSDNYASYFINYRDLKNGRLDYEAGKIYDTYHFSGQSVWATGLSSPELAGINMEESLFGLSSAELFGINISKHLGISSENIIR